jgi:hypothetical protein
MWENLKTRAGAVLIPLVAVALGILAAILWLRFADRPAPIYVPGPGSVNTVYETKWRDRIKPVPYIVPTGAVMEFFPKIELARVSKIPDAPDNTIAFGQVPPHGGRTTVFATLKPGADNVLRGGLEYRQEAIPFWDLKREIHGGIYYGVAGQNSIEGQVRLNFLRTGPVNWNSQGRVGIERDGGRMNGALLVGAEF